MRFKPVRRISRRPCVTVQPSHLWCCFASPKKETVVGHVASGRQLGGGRREEEEYDKEHAVRGRVNVRHR